MERPAFVLTIPQKDQSIVYRCLVCLMLREPHTGSVTEPNCDSRSEEISLTCSQFGKRVIFNVSRELISIPVPNFCIFLNQNPTPTHSFERVPQSILCFLPIVIHNSIISYSETRLLKILFE